MARDHESTSDQQAMVQTLFIKHGPSIRGYLLALVPDENVADDLLHAVFLAVTAKAEKFRPGSNFLAWARTIAKYEALQLARDRAKAPTSLSPEVIEQLSTTAPDFDNTDERLGMMRECIETLAPRAKEAIQLRYAQALEPVDIAERMKLAVKSVSVTLSRARASLRKCIERKLKQRGDN